MYCWSITFTFTKTSDLSKFLPLQRNPYWMCLNQVSSWCKHPHPLLPRHDLTHVMLSSSAQVLTVLPLCSYISKSSSTEGAPQHDSTCNVLADAGFLCQYSMHRERIKGTLYQSGQIREVARSMEGTTKEVANIWQTFQIINLINVSTIISYAAEVWRLYCLMKYAV